MELDLFDETGKITEEQTKMVKTLLGFAGSHINLPEDTEMSVTFVDNAARYIRKWLRVNSKSCCCNIFFFCFLFSISV